MATTLELAQFAAAAYGDSPAPDPKKWQLVATSAPNAYGYFAQAYVNSSTNEVVIANRGTRPTSLLDYWSDLNLSLKFPTKAQFLAENFALSVAGNLLGGPYKFIETGHSLGGNDAQAGLVALVKAGYDASGATFNSPGIGGYKSYDVLYQCVNYYAQGDFIHLSGGKHIGTEQTLAAGASKSDAAPFLPLLALGPIGTIGFFAKSLFDTLGPNHSIDTIVDYLKGVSTGPVEPSAIHYVPGQGFSFDNNGTHIALSFDEDGTPHYSQTFDSVVSTSGGIKTHYISDGSNINVSSEGLRNGYTSKASYSTGQNSSTASLNGQDLKITSVLEVKIDAELNLGEKASYLANADGTVDVKVTGPLWKDGVLFQRDMHLVSDKLIGSSVSYSKANGELKQSQIITEDGIVTDRGAILHADGSYDDQYSHFNADGSGYYRVSSGNYQGNYFVDAQGEITAHGENRSTENAGYKIETWNISGGKNKIIVSHFDRTEKLISVDSEYELDVESDIEVSNDVITHKASGIRVDAEGKIQSVSHNSLYIKFNSGGNIDAYGLNGFYVSKNLVQYFGAGYDIAFTENTTPEATSIWVGEDVNYSFRNNGYSSYTVSTNDDYTSATFNPSGLMVSNYASGIGGANFGAGFFSAQLTGDSPSIDLNNGTIHHSFSNGNGEYFQNVDGSKITLEGDNFTSSDGSHGSIEHNGDAETITTIHPDGTRDIVTKRSDGVDEAYYSAAGNLIHTKETIGNQWHTMDYSDDGSYVDFIRYASGDYAIQKDDGKGNVSSSNYNRDDKLTRTSISYADGSGSWSSYDSDGNLFHTHSYSIDEKISDTYFVDGNTIFVSPGTDNSYFLSATGSTNFELLFGGYRSDVITTSANVSFVAGGKGNDSILLSTNPVVMGYNKGDGNDIVSSLTGSIYSSNTISLGNIDFGALSLNRSSNDLILKFGDSDSITLNKWYMGLHSFSKLQFISDSISMSGLPSSSPLLSSKVIQLDLIKLVGNFDDATSHGLAFNMTDELSIAIVSQSDIIAVGGDFSYYYGHGEDMSTLKFAPGSPSSSGISIELAGQFIHEYSTVFDPPVFV